MYVFTYGYLYVLQNEKSILQKIDDWSLQTWEPYYILIYYWCPWYVSCIVVVVVRSSDVKVQKGVLREQTIDFRSCMDWSSLEMLFQVV